MYIAEKREPFGEKHGNALKTFLYYKMIRNIRFRFITYNEKSIQKWGFIFHISITKYVTYRILNRVSIADILSGVANM